MTSGNRKWEIAALLLLMLTAAAPASAYLDPSTASMVISAIVGLFATATLAIKTYWYKLKGFFRKKSAKEPDAREQPSSDAEITSDP